MTYFNKIKNCLVKLKVAQLEKKKILFLHKLHVPSKLLEVLYTGGLILGYIKSKFFYQVFLKYNSIGVGVLELLVLLNSKAFKAISLEPHAKYLVLSNTTNLEIFSSSTQPTKKFRGIIIAKY